MPENDNNSKLVVELKSCTKCGNPFMIKQEENLTELVCENCIKLEQRKRDLQLGVFEKVIEVENKMEESINEMKNSLRMSRGEFNKDFFVKEIKRRAEALKTSIELIEKIEETDDEKYIDEYIKLFEKMKNETI